MRKNGCTSGLDTNVIERERRILIMTIVSKSSSVVDFSAAEFPRQVLGHCETSLQGRLYGGEAGLQWRV